MISTPYITTIVVAYNEEKYIKKCLESLLNQDYPKNMYEIIIVDGYSNDNTVQIIKKTINDYELNNSHENNDNLISSKLIYNDKKTLASGWNLAIKQSRGDYIVRIDAHAEVQSNFLMMNITTMMEIKDASCVGGKIKTVNINNNQSIVQHVLSSPYGIGNSKFRYSNKSEYVDTVPYGMYKKSVFDEIGLFNENLERTQDNDLHRRMKSKGMRFYLNTNIQSIYYSRDSIKKVLKQALNNGKWTMINFLSNPGKMSLRYFVPFSFLTLLIVLLFLSLSSIFFFYSFIALLILHLTLGFIFAALKTLNPIHIIKMQVCFLLIHLSYGIGSYLGIIKKTLNIKG